MGKREGEREGDEGRGKREGGEMGEGEEGGRGDGEGGVEGGGRGGRVGGWVKIKACGISFGGSQNFVFFTFFYFPQIMSNNLKKYYLFLRKSALR